METFSVAARRGGLVLALLLVVGWTAGTGTAQTAKSDDRTAHPAGPATVGPPPSAAPLVTSPGPAAQTDGSSSAADPGRVALVPRIAGGTFGYLVRFPGSPAPAAGYPTIVYLHGFGERGNGSDDALALLEQTGLPQLAARSTWPTVARPLLLLAPQTGAQTWNVQDLHEWLREVELRYPVDPHRLYLTGISMGGGGVVSYLDEFGPASGIAAAAPIAGDWTPSPPVTGLPSCRRLGGIPIWAFAGDIDDVVPHQLSINLIAYLQRHCADPGVDRLTIYTGRFHNVWTNTYDLSGRADKTDPRFESYDPDVFTWLLQHRLD